MSRLRIRLIHLARSSRVALGMFVTLVLGTAAFTLSPRAANGGGSAPAARVEPVAVVTQEAAGVTFAGQLSQAKVVQGAPGVVYLDLQITTPAAPATAGIRASDLIVVLDRSGSMAVDNRLPYAKEAVRHLLSRLGPEDRFALVTFDTTAMLHTDLTPVSDVMREQIVRRVHALQPGSSTNISEGLLRARALVQGPASERSRKVILLSDGEANTGIVDPKELGRIAASFAEHRTVLSTIGLGLGFNETLMASLADYGMGQYGYLEHLARLGEILAKDMQDTRQVYASASGLEMALGEGVTVTDAGGYPLDMTSKPGTVRVLTGQLLSGTTRHLVVTMHLPTQHQGTVSLGDVTLHYDTSAGTRQATLSREQLRVAVLEPARRAEAVASVDQSLFKKLWEQNNLGRLQKEYSQWLRSGDKTKAEQAISDYRQAMQAAERATGVPVESPAVSEQLNHMEKEMQDAFTGPASVQQEKRNRAAKSRHDAALKSQRSQ
ncbi:MAG: VWA domain-containing protein [Candidatus Tectimicrobiota bacterium]